MMFGLGPKAWAAIAVAVVVGGGAIAGVAMADGEEFDPVYAPAWQPGYSFSYDVTADFATVAMGFEDLGVPEEAAYTVGPVPVKKEVLATGYEDSTGAPVYVSAANVPLSSIQLGSFFGDFGSAPAFATAERRADLAPVPVFPDNGCDNDDCATGGLVFPAPNPVTYLNFPLTPDKRWEDTVDLGIPIPLEELQGLDRMHYIGEVGGIESVDLGALGVTDAVRVDISYTPVGLEEFVNMMASQAEEMGFELERYTLQIGIHEIVHYSPEYEAIVKQEYILHGLVDIAINGEFHGEEIDLELYAEIDAIVGALLTGAEHPQGLPDKSPTEILAMVGNPALIHDAAGNAATIERVDYTVSLVGEGLDPNVADGEATSFATGLHGVDALPDGHTFTYSVTDALGQIVAEGDAYPGFSFELDEPGVYTVSAKAFDEHGALMSGAREMVYADYEGYYPADCGITILVGPSCDFELDVMPGVDSLTVEAVTYAPAISSDLRVTDAAGEVVGSGYDRVTISEFEGFELGVWDVAYDAYAHADFSPEFYVVLDYAPSGFVQHAQHDDVGDADAGNGGLDAFDPAVIGAIDDVLGMFS